MFRSFAVIIEIAILVVVLQLPFVQYLFSDVQNSLSHWMEEIATREERQQLAEIKGKLEVQYSAMRPSQQEYFDAVLSSRARTIQFYDAYCENSDRNPYIFGVTLHSFCSELRSSPVIHVPERDS
ncbi:hypothetical protein [Alteromonas lipolytica]|uniref:Uncharacterized protein n=1 Tax=Alteromonas lipolytica TaxID=1856405 RepID=A0A1E8FD72_9ALTE|nr:hypothetical protein [Alteromonas lipolytica]OFI33706.1 hypothetical protein BFC17_19190 [Alteromonas lipolytica]GGF69191.1 hypothetical protein GCM10011338_21670 [Alteromonas lipolytica]